MQYLKRLFRIALEAVIAQFSFPSSVLTYGCFFLKIQVAVKLPQGFVCCSIFCNPEINFI